MKWGIFSWDHSQIYIFDLASIVPHLNCVSWSWRQGSHKSLFIGIFISRRCIDQQLQFDSQNLVSVYCATRCPDSYSRDTSRGFGHINISLLLFRGCLSFHPIKGYPWSRFSVSRFSQIALWEYFLFCATLSEDPVSMSFRWSDRLLRGTILEKWQMPLGIQNLCTLRALLGKFHP
jgi:hypothetical protein